MIADLAQGLAGGGLIDITTTGRRTGQPRRIKIVAHVIDGHVYISGMPRRQRRSWLANLEAEPRLIVHLKQGPAVDLPARARIVTDEAERRVILAHVARRWKRTDLDVMVAWSPLIEVFPADGPPDRQRRAGRPRIVDAAPPDRRPRSSRPAMMRAGWTGSCWC